MELQNILKKKKAVILEKWLAAIFDTYPADTAAFLKGERDMFSNPVGCTITANAEYILEGLINGEDTDSLSAHVERIIRIRAVQHFTPAQAVSFINSLNAIIIDQLKSELNRPTLWDEWEELKARIDSLSLVACETYAQMKDRIQHIRMKELADSERFLIKLMGSRSR